MTVSADPKRRITVAAAKQVRQLAKPAYVAALERETAQGTGPFDNAGGPFPFDIPSQAFRHHLEQLDEAIARAQHELDQLRSLAHSIRSVAEGRIEEAVDPPHDPSIHEPPPPPEPGQTAVVSGIDTGMTMAEIEAEMEAIATHQPVVVKAEPPAPVPAMTWTCPVHGEFAEAVSRKGRPYRYCPRPDCGRLDIMGLPS